MLKAELEQELARTKQDLVGAISTIKQLNEYQTNLEADIEDLERKAASSAADARTKLITEFAHAAGKAAYENDMCEEVEKAFTTAGFEIPKVQIVVTRIYTTNLINAYRHGVMTTDGTTGDKYDLESFIDDLDYHQDPETSYNAKVLPL